MRDNRCQVCDGLMHKDGVVFNHDQCHTIPITETKTVGWKA